MVRKSSSFQKIWIILETNIKVETIVVEVENIEADRVRVTWEVPEINCVDERLAQDKKLKYWKD